MRFRVLKLFAAFVATSLATRWLSLVVEVVDHDETCHFIGARVLASGGLLYTEFVDNKPPFLYAYYALAQLLAGKSLLGVHLVTAVLVVPLTALAVSAFYEHARPGVVAAFAFLLYGAAFIGHDMLASNAEIVMILPASWALVLLRREPDRGSTVRCLFAGVLLGTAVLVKPQVGIWAAVCALVWFHARAVQGRWARGAAEVSAMVAGSVLPLAAVYAWFARRGGAGAFAYWVVWHNLWYADNPILAAEALRRFAAYFLPFLIVTAPLWWATFAGSRLVEPRSRRLLVRGLVAASVVPAFLGFRFYPHYFVQLYVPLALVAGPWLDSQLRRPLPRAGRVVAGWSAAMLLGFSVANAVLYLGPVDVYRERDPVFRAVADRLRSEPCAPGPVFVWGWAPMIYYYAELPIASRFVVLPQARLAGYVPGNTESNRGNAAEGAIVPAHWDWLMSDLERNRATFIVDTAPANIFRWGRYPVARYPRLQQYLDRSFELAGDVRGVRVYRRRGCQADRAGDAGR